MWSLKGPQPGAIDFLCITDSVSPECRVSALTQYEDSGGEEPTSLASCCKERVVFIRVMRGPALKHADEDRGRWSELCVCASSPQEALESCRALWGWQHCESHHCALAEGLG